MKRHERDALYGIDERRGPDAGLLERALAFILRRAALVLVAGLAVVVGAGHLASKMPLVTDFAELLPDDARAIREHHRARPYVGNASVFLLLVEPERGAGDDRPAPEAMTRARAATDALAERLARDPEFVLVAHRVDRAFFEKNALLYLDLDQLEDLHARLRARIESEVLARNPLYIDFDDEGSGSESGSGSGLDVFDPESVRAHYVAERHQSLSLREYFADDRGAHVIVAQPRLPAADMGYNKTIIARVATHLADARAAGELPDDIAVSQSGNYIAAEAENLSVKSDLRKAGLISLGFLLVIVTLYFRRVRAALIIFVPLLSGVVAMMGYVALAVGRLNTITGFCFALFMGLSIDFAIHVLARYDEERGRGAGVFAALCVTYREKSRAALTATATSAVGFLSLVVADFQGFREFGVIASGGIVICLGMIAVLMPAVIALAARFVPESRFARSGADRTTSGRPFPAATLAVIGIAVVAAIASQSPGLQWEDDLRNLRGGSPEILETQERARAILGRSTQPAVRIADTLEEARDLASACNRERDRRDARAAQGETSAVELCVSLGDFVPTDQPAKLAVIDDIRGLISDSRLELADGVDPQTRQRLIAWRDRAATRPVTETDLPEAIRRNLVSAEGGKYLMNAYPRGETWTITSYDRFYAELKAIDDVSPDDIGPVGPVTILSDAMRVMKWDALVIIAVALVVVLVVLVVLSRSVTRGLACYLPLVAGFVATLGAMALLDMRLGFFNMIVVPSLIGIGVDNNIYLLHRYHVEGRYSWSRVVSTTGLACIMAAVTTMAGFGGLLFAGHPGLRSIGTMALLGITILTTVSIVLVPSVLMVLERRLSGTGRGLLPR